MGTKVQCKTFLPIYCSMREADSETSNGWPSFYEDPPRRLQFHDSSASMCIDGFLEYDKLVLKQTMLKHEAVFRSQVFELHRLYGRQREMMDELKRQTKCSFAWEARTSQSSATSPNLLQVDGSNVLERSSEVSASITRPSIPSIGDRPHSSEGINGTEIQISSMSKGTSVLKNHEKLGQNLGRVSKILIDLQLPADAYIDTEDTGQGDTTVAGRTPSGLSLPRNRSANDESDFVHELNCSLGNTELNKSNLGLQHGSSSLDIADLNEPVKDVCFEEVCTSTSSMLPRKEFLRNQDNQSVLETCSSSRNVYNCSRDLPNEGDFHSILRDTGTVQKRPRLLLTRKETGPIECNRKSSFQNIFRETLADMSEFGQVIPTRTEDSSSYMSNQNKNEELLRGKTYCQNNLSGRNQTPGNMCSAAAQTYSSLSFLAELEHAPRISSLNVWEKRVCGIDAPTNVEGLTGLRSPRTGKSECSSLDPSAWKFDYLPCQSFDSEMIYHSSGYHDKLHIGSNLLSDVKLPKTEFDKSDLFSAKVGSKLFDEPITEQSHTKGFHGIDLKIGKDFNLNQALPNGFSDGSLEQSGHKVLESKKPPPGIPWLSRNHCKESFDLNKALETEIDSENSPKMTTNEVPLPQESHRNIVDPGILMDHKQLRVRKEMPENPGWKKIHGVSIADVHDAEQELRFSGFSGKIGFLDLEKPVDEGQAINDDDLGCNGIDLNSVAMDVNHLKSGNASDAKVQVSLRPSASNLTGRCTGIDLELTTEALTKLMAAEVTHVCGQKYVDQKKDVNISQISSNTAAEIIVCMSSNTNDCVERSMALMHSPDPADLLWFAGVVTSQRSLLSDATFSSSVCEGENCASSDVDGMDFFEAMTLRLTEPDVENLLFTSPVIETDEENDGKFSSLLLTKPRRGQARRRRQKRDFQKDVLPGLASLSRQEVTEDLQTIGGMMRASGLDWQNSTARRNNGRGGRGRRQQPRKAAATVVVEDLVEPPPKEPGFVELEMEGISMMGWGSTRRCRRPRCPPGNITAQALS